MSRLVEYGARVNSNPYRGAHRFGQSIATVCVQRDGSKKGMILT